MRLAFDLDGTLWDTDPSINYLDPSSILASCRPHADACARVSRLARAGHRILYLTGRENSVRAVTHQQIKDAGLPDGPVSMQLAWRGFPAMVSYKARELSRFGADLFVGDHAADEEAASAAGVPFLHARAFRVGDLFIPRALHLPVHSARGDTGGVDRVGGQGLLAHPPPLPSAAASDDPAARGAVLGRLSYPSGLPLTARTLGDARP